MTITTQAQINAVGFLIQVSKGEAFFSSQHERDLVINRACQLIKTVETLEAKPEVATVSDEQIDEAVGLAVHKAMMNVTKQVICEVRKDLKESVKPKEPVKVEPTPYIGDIVFVNDNINLERYYQLRVNGFSKGMKLVLKSKTRNLKGLIDYVCYHERTGRTCRISPNLVTKVCN